MTGAGRGIGLATVVACLDAGARVLATDLAPLPGKGLQALIDRDLPVDYRQQDVIREADWAAIAAHVEQRCGGVLDVV